MKDILIIIILLISMVILLDISNTLHKVYEDKVFRITEVIHKEKFTYDIKSYGVVVLPDDDFNTKGYDEAFNNYYPIH